MQANRIINNSVVFFVTISLILPVFYGCATRGQTGAAAGTGVGALIGQAIGRNTAGTLIGAGIGAGMGYLIGNDMDKRAAAEHQAMGEAPETGALGGTKWKAVKMDPPADPPYETYIVEFTPDGWLMTSETFADGTVKNDKERYRVAGDTLIINSPGYLVNAKYAMENNRLKVMLEDYNAEFMKIN